MALPSPSPSPSWVILGNVARVSAADNDLPPGADFSIALAEAPRVALLTIPPRLFPDRITSDNFPSVVATHPSGLLLLHANQGRAKGPTIIDTPGRQEFCWKPFVAGYFLLDADKSAALPLPNPELIMNPGELGLLTAPGDNGHYMVAELQPVFGSNGATLICFSSEVGEWVEKAVVNPLPRWMRNFSDVVSHGGRLWWVDRVAGLLACDPFADEPDMVYVRLPDDDVQAQHGHGCSYCSKRELGTRRLVQLIEGRFRCVEMSCARHGALKVSMRTLVDSGTAEWALDFEASFPEIWADESYKTAELPEKAPALVLVHPKNPDVVYFFLDKHLFGVDLRARKVVECEPYKPAKPQKKGHCLVLPFELPPALSAELGAKSTNNSVNEEPSVSPSSESSTSNRL